MKKKFYLVLLIIFGVLLAGSGSWGLTESSEARYAEIAREMVRSGDYLHPALLGIHHYHKPPVTYWITALGYQIFGINEFGARFFLSIALVFQIFFVFKISLKLFRNTKIAFASAIIYFTFPVVLIAARNLTTDAFLTTFILWALYFWLKRKEGGAVLYLYGYYLLLGLGMLTKGPVVLLPPLIFILFWKMVKREKLRVTLNNSFGMILFLLISASWYVAVVLDHPALLDYFVQEQIVKRSLEAEKFHRSEPFWYYFVLAPLIGLPWILFSTSDVIKNFRGILKNRDAELILLLSIGLLFLIFSLFSSKLVLYVLPIFPFIALLGGSVLFRTSGGHIKAFSYIYFGLFILLTLGLGVLIFMEKYHFDLWAALPVILFSLASGFYFLKYRKAESRFRPVYMGLSFTIALLASFALFAAQNPNPINSTKNLVQVVEEKTAGKENKVIIYDYLLPSASFYLDQEIVTVHKDNFNTRREVEFENGHSFRNTYINLQKEGEEQHLKDLLQEENNVLIMRKRTQLEDSLKYILKDFGHSEEVGKWRVYY